MTPQPVSARTKATINRHRQEEPLPVSLQNDKPAVTWRCSTCIRKQGGKPVLLRLYLTLDGWYLHGENYRVDLATWFTEIGMDPAIAIAARSAGEIVPTQPRKKKGMHVTLPLGTSEWPKGRRFQIGCRNCGQATAELDVLRDDADHFRATRTRVERAFATRAV